jgi:signal transduction histidine kinase
MPATAIHAADIVDSLREPLLLLDEDFRVLLANRSFFKTFAVEPAQTVGALLRSLGNGQWDIPRLLELIQTVRAEGRSFDDFEVSHDFPGLGRRVMLLNARLLRRDDGKENVVILAIEDITLRKGLEDALSRQSAELERSNRDLQEFAYVASHDLQEPLRMVVSYTELLQRRYKGRLGEDADDFIGFAVDGAKRMQRLISDLLAYSRLDRRQYAPKLVSAADAVGTGLLALGTAIEECGARIEVSDLPAVVADAGQLAQLFQNLIGNAIKFRAPDRPPVIRVSAERDGAFWRFRVSDNGIGIDSRYFDKVFVIFERLHGLEVPGTGIGLAFCRKIVGRHGGRIWLESVVGQGSTILFTLRADVGDTDAR